MKDSAAVGDSEWIQFIANHDLRSQFVIAHTRKATRGTRSYPNAQPFVRELAGRAHFFAHNGDLPGIFKSNAFQADGSTQLARPTPNSPFVRSSTNGGDLDGAKCNADAPPRDF